MRLHVAGGMSVGADGAHVRRVLVVGTPMSADEVLVEDGLEAAEAGLAAGGAAGGGSCGHDRQRSRRIPSSRAAWRSRSGERVAVKEEVAIKEEAVEGGVHDAHDHATAVRLRNGSAGTLPGNAAGNTGSTAHCASLQEQLSPAELVQLGGVFKYDAAASTISAGQVLFRV